MFLKDNNEVCVTICGDASLHFLLLKSSMPCHFTKLCLIHCPKSLINLSLIFASAIRVFLRDFGTEVVTHAWRVQIMGRDFENNLRRHLCGQSCLHTHKHKHICAHVHMQHLGRIPTSNWNLFLCLPKLPPFTLAISILFYACLTQL